MFILLLITYRKLTNFALDDCFLFDTAYMNQLFAIQEVTNMYQSYLEVTYAEKQ